MQLQSLHLQNVRIFEDVTFLPAPGVNIIRGQNAQGKTTLLEAVVLSSVGRSQRTKNDGEMVRFGCDTARVEASVLKDGNVNDVHMTLFEKAGERKKILLNGASLPRMMHLMGAVTSVFFGPDDLSLVKYGPDDRRRFLDMALSQIYPTYFDHLQRYHKAMAHRNKLLKLSRQKPHEDWSGGFDAWEEVIVSNATPVLEKRAMYFAMLQQHASKAQKYLTDGQEDIELRYFSRSPTPKSLRNHLLINREVDIERGHTVHGPHRDDLRIAVNGNDCRSFSSQGQQRTVVLALKLAEWQIAYELTGNAPILLLDDVFSELDKGRRERLLEAVQAAQTFITTTDTEAKGTCWRVEKGKVRGE